MSEEVNGVLLAGLVKSQAEQTQILGRMEGKLDGIKEQVDRHDKDIDDLKATKNRAIGVNAAFATAVAAWEVIKHYWKLS